MNLHSKNGRRRVPARRTMRRGAVGIAAALVPLTAGSVLATDPVPAPDSGIEESLARIAGDPLTLEDALARARVEATDARDAELALDSAAGALRGERGAFDPVLFADLDLSSTDTPTASPFSGADVLEETTRSARAGARWRLPLGTELSATLETRRLETNSVFAALDPEVSTTGRLDVRQPLLRGFGPAARGDLTAAERDLLAAQASRDDVRRRVETAVVATYWNLHAGERDLAVQRLIVERAEALLEEATLRSEAGLVGPNEVAIARGFLAQQRLTALDREEELDAISDRLATLTGARPGGGHARFRSVGEPADVLPGGDVEALVARALRTNGEILAATRRHEAARARAAGARWDALPGLDLLGSVGGSGLSGTGRSVTFGDETFTSSADGGFSDSWSQFAGGDYPIWNVGLRLEVPLGFRAGRGEHDRRRAEAARAEQELIARRRDLEERIRAVHRELDRGRRRLEIAREGVAASLEQVRIGRAEYSNGRTTAFELVRLGADLAEAQRRHSEALVRTARAAAELERLAPPAPTSSPTPEERP